MSAIPDRVNICGAETHAPANSLCVEPVDLVCDREAGHAGAHDDSEWNTSWSEAPPVEAVGLLRKLRGAP